jgi:hypothetical protein
MKTIGVEHKIKMGSFGNWVIVFIVVVVWFIWSGLQLCQGHNYSKINLSLKSVPLSSL